MGRKTNEYPCIKFNEDCSKCQIEFRYEDIEGKVRKKKKSFEIIDYSKTKVQRKEELSKRAYTYRAKIKSKKKEIMTFNEFVENKFWKECEEDGLSASTTDRYKDILKRVENSFLGDMYLDDIEEIHLKTFYNSLKSEQTIITKTGKERKYKLDNRTILHHQKVVSSVLSRAKYDGDVKRNVADNVKNVKVEPKETPTLQIDEILKMLKLLEDEDIVHKTIVSLAVYSRTKKK